jgi:hypothetical protein
MKACALPRAAAPLLLAALLLNACPFTYEKEEPGRVPGEDIAQRSDLFLRQEGSPGRYVFFTNDRELWGPYGCTLWTLTGIRQEPFVERCLALQKISGDPAAGFGAILCRRDDPLWGETMLVVLVNTRQEYTVGEVTGTEFQYLLPWAQCPALVAGYALNRLRVQSDGQKFQVYFNGLPACDFRDEEAPLHPGGDDGLIVVISPQDRFPQSGVHVVFEELPP